MRQGLLTITDYKKKASYVTDTNATLPDEQNTRFPTPLSTMMTKTTRRVPEDNEGYIFTVSTEDV